ncbi:hypothetical protein NLG97_g6265 [Lecanicillium saksenae]|uniref:Uncharacterized protein n=1 Tax=Lecanicillium saksenae TaxID=468837 RepID=A0ACC1QR96_9HYPO|nr:hypothetical protein NLG97_g6265 [Lecanicillium saksenae]
MLHKTQLLVALTVANCVSALTGDVYLYEEESCQGPRRICSNMPEYGCCGSRGSIFSSSKVLFREPCVRAWLYARSSQSNDLCRVALERSSGCVTHLYTITGSFWSSDPSPGSMSVEDADAAQPDPALCRAPDLLSTDVDGWTYSIMLNGTHHSDFLQAVDEGQSSRDAMENYIIQNADAKVPREDETISARC